MWIARRAFGVKWGQGSLASPGTPAARAVPSRSSRLARAAEPSPCRTHEKNARRSSRPSGGGAFGVAVMALPPSIDKEELAAVEEGPGEHGQPVLPDGRPGPGQLAGVGRPGVGQ